MIEWLIGAILFVCLVALLVTIVWALGAAIWVSIKEMLEKD